jgi:antirestriction protein ArdC
MTKRTMARVPRDSGWINLEEPREVSYWTTVLAVNEARLRAAVRAAGDATSAVRQYLGGQQRDGRMDDMADDDAADAAVLRQMASPTGRSPSPSGTQQQG